MANDSWATPPEVVAKVEAWLGLNFMLDVCATEENKKAQFYIDEDQDSLSCDWADYEEHGHHPGYPLWLNPPYSKPLPWCQKAAEESRKGLIVVGLLKDDRSTRWYREYVEGVASVCLVPNKRISFIDPATGKPGKGNNFASVLPIWTPWSTGRTGYVRIDL